MAKTVILGKTGMLGSEVEKVFREILIFWFSNLSPNVEISEGDKSPFSVL